MYNYRVFVVRNVFPVRLTRHSFCEPTGEFSDMRTNEQCFFLSLAIRPFQLTFFQKDHETFESSGPDIHFQDIDDLFTEAERIHRQGPNPLLPRMLDQFTSGPGLIQVTGRTLVLSKLVCRAAVRRHWLNLICHSTQNMTIVDFCRILSREQHEAWLTEDMEETFTMALPSYRFTSIQCRVIQFRSHEGSVP